MFGKKWKTSEHIFQSLKFDDEEYREVIRNTSTPGKAFILARQKIVSGYKWRTDLNHIISKYLDKGGVIRSDWHRIKVDIMLDIIRVKFTQDEHCKNVLLSTGNRQLIEHTHRDRFWGDGGDGSGKNMLGKCLMKIRDELKKK